MAQHDYVIDNSTGANVRADINNALLAISSNNSGSSAPSTTYALQTFANTTDSMLQLRNAANNAFVNLRKFDGTLPLPDGSNSAPSLFFDDDTNTGIYSDAADTFNIATGGVSRLEIDASEITFNDGGADTDFRVESDTNTHAIFLQASNSRVGINTSSPNDELEVTGNVQVTSGSIKVTSSNPSIKFTDSDASGGFALVGNNSTSGSLVMRSDDGNALSGSFMGFEIDGGEKMRIANNGALCVNSTSGDNNVHVGITSSSTGIILKAAGDHHSLIDANSNRASAGNTLHRYMGRWNGTQVASMAFVTGSDTTNKDDGVITFNTSSADNLAEKARITSDGKFGVGASTIGERLTIGDGDLKFFHPDAGNAHRTTFIEFGNSSNRITSESNFGSDGSSGYSAGYKFTTKNYTGSAFETLTPFVIQANGNVGVGSTAPSASTAIFGGTQNCLVVAGSAAPQVRIASSTSNQGDLLLIAGNSGADCVIANAANGGDLLFSTNSSGAQATRFQIDDSGKCFMPEVFNRTSGSAVNMRVDSDGELRRSTSSKRYKKCITDATWGLAEVLKLKPITYKSNASGKDANDKIFGGFTAEDVHDIGLTEFVDYNDDNEPDAIAYGNMVSLAAKAIQELAAKVTVLETKVATLESA